MAKIVFTTRALSDIERAFEFIAERDPGSGARAVAAIRGAIQILADHPLVGRSVESRLRELVISYGKTGYLALYWFEQQSSQIWVLAIRHQREMDYGL